MFERMIQRQMEAIREERNRNANLNVSTSAATPPATTNSTEEKPTPPPSSTGQMPPAPQSTVVNNVVPTPEEEPSSTAPPEEQVSPQFLFHGYHKTRTIFQFFFFTTDSECQYDSTH